MPHIQRCNWIENNLTGQGMQRNTEVGLFTKSSNMVVINGRDLALPFSLVYHIPPVRIIPNSLLYHLPQLSEGQKVCTATKSIEDAGLTHKRGPSIRTPLQRDFLSTLDFPAILYYSCIGVIIPDRWQL